VAISFFQAGTAPHVAPEIEVEGLVGEVEEAQGVAQWVEAVVDTVGAAAGEGRRGGREQEYAGYQCAGHERGVDDRSHGGNLRGRVREHDAGCVTRM
jgi:hypothetical protein